MDDRKNKFALIIVFAGTLLAGCASVPKTTPSPAHRIDRNAAVIASIHSLLAAQSQMAQSMDASGDMTLDNNGETNSASFAMKSKRLDARGNRIDSLSIEVMGPFGIKVAKFLASPDRYEFYDILHDQTMSGATDAKSLEDLTQLKGVSLGMMSDLIYGLATGDVQPNDSEQFYSNGESHHALIVQNANKNTTSMLDFEGTVPNDSTTGNLTLVRYRRWNGVLDPMENKLPPAVAVHFSEPIAVNGVSIPQHIEATAGQNKLTLSYDHIDVNPTALTVKIKMPQ